MLTDQRLKPDYSIDELERDLRSGILGWLKPDMELTTEIEIKNDDDLMRLNRQLYKLKKLTDRLKISYTEVISTGDPVLPDSFNRTGIIHIIKIKWK